ncbi:MAG TPA: flagellar hook assembly protein FlgD [Spirochaetia bacterium]|jgi:flagellar basal-body rod modification protein FlgD|nr:flagellar hook assembly protein FlgD [Spirochaetia bacterium]
MDISLSLSAQDQARTSQQVDAFNKTLNEGKGAKPNAALDKNDFLKILITQLSHQDPTQPMDDKAFISQMAQFSSLEQMSNMSEGLTKVADLISRSQAVSLLGSAVEIGSGESTVSGIVEAVTSGNFPQVLVNGQYYDFSQVQKVKRDLKE